MRGNSGDPRNIEDARFKKGLSPVFSAAVRRRASGQ